MDILHSYWRTEYIRAPKGPGGIGNPFAKLAETKDDRAALIVYRGPTSYLVLNKFPYNPGHLLALPYREIGDLSDLRDDERSDLMETIVKGKVILARALNPDGFNIGFNLGSTAGAGIPAHLHCHIVPRWNGDTNFMPVVGKTRVLPQALESTWEQLRKFC